MSTSSIEEHQVKQESVAVPGAEVLLLSRGMGAVPAFVARAHGQGPATVGFVDAASAGYRRPPVWITTDLANLRRWGHRVREIDLTALSGRSVDRALDGLDVLYVAGGNTFVLLHHLHASGLFESLPGHLERGLRYIGASAGAIVAGPHTAALAAMDSPQEAPERTPAVGLGLVPVIPVPHADGKLPPYPPTLIARILAADTGGYPMQPITDQEALVMVDGKLELIASPTRLGTTRPPSRGR